VKARIVLGVCALWIAIGAVMGAQASMSAALQGASPVPLDRALIGGMLQMAAWIPTTLVAIAVATLVPITRGTWQRRVPVHLMVALAMSFVANVLVVLGFWARQGVFNGVGALARGGLLWGTINLHIALVVYAAVVSITHGVLYYRRMRERELQLAKVEGQLARAQLQALNAQIRPHFLFNTLHTIGQLWRSGRSEEADTVLDHLGGLFHKVERSTSRLEVPLAEELELVEEYLAIESARFRDRLHTRVVAPRETLDCLVPPLILQPLVENAIRHGISAVSTATRVEVMATLTGNHLYLTVHDDGPGVTSRSPQPGTGTGLRNTRERLAQLYGPGDHLRVEDAPSGGTIVTVDIPLNGARRIST
jgi:signal transduction histidine kinase